MRGVAWLALALSLGTLRGQAQTPELPAHPSELRPPPLQPYTPRPPRRLGLGRGAELLVLEDGTLPLVEGALVFRGGTRHDPPAQAGRTELLAEALRAGGSLHRPGAALDDELDALAAAITIRALPEAVRVEFDCLSEDLDAVLEAIGELLIRPAYPSAEIDRARRRSASVHAARASSARETADEVALRLAFGQTAAPPATDLGGVGREELLALHRARFGVDRLVVGMVGDVEATTLAAKLETLLARLPRAAAPLRAVSRNFRLPARTRVYLLDRPGAAQSEVRCLAPGMRRLNRDFTAASLWSFAVGFGGSSTRLMASLRTERGLVYDGTLHFTPGWEEAGCVFGAFSTRNESVGEASAALVELLRESLRPFSDEELELTRLRLQRAEVFQVDRPRRLLDRALDLRVHGYPLDFWERHAERLRNLSPEAVAEAVARYVDPERLTFLVSGPAALIEEQLQDLGEIVRVGTPGSEPPGTGAELSPSDPAPRLPSSSD